MGGIRITPDYTLFLDRDGVINKRLMGDYVQSWEEFEFIPGSLEAIAKASSMFETIVVVTNQQGIAKKLMTEQDLADIHGQMVEEVTKAGGRIDHVYHCPELASEDPHCRKPNLGMANQAKAMFPKIDFEKSIMVGDSISDMQFGERLSMKCCFIGENDQYDSYESLIHVIESITSK